MNIAVILCGSGRADGSEIHESVACLIHLARLHAKYRCFAPDAPQVDVVNHLTGKQMPETRNMLVEAARIARGQISPIQELAVSDFDGVIFPGGFGAAKNLCTFAKDGDRCSVHPQVERIIREFHSAEKPIGMCCIAPVIGAKVLGKESNGPGVKVTVGQPSDAAASIARMGSAHVAKSVTESCVDERHKIATTPAYMDDGATAWQVYQGIGKMVEDTVALAAARARAHRPAVGV